MASLRQLPSGKWQATVLLPSGKRTTRSCATPEEARAWGEEVESRRDALRREKELLSRRGGVALHLAALEELVEQSALTEYDRSALLRLAALAQERARE